MEKQKRWGCLLAVVIPILLIALAIVIFVHLDPSDSRLLEGDWRLTAYDELFIDLHRAVDHVTCSFARIGNLAVTYHYPDGTSDTFDQSYVADGKTIEMAGSKGVYTIEQDTLTIRFDDGTHMVFVRE